MRSLLARRVDAAIRLGLVHGGGRIRGDILVNEYPKSGGSWIAQMLGDLLGIPFPANRFPTLGRCLLHGHHLSTFGTPRTLVVWRDGRDVMVSWYFHSLFRNERENSPLVERVRRELNFSEYEDIRTNLPVFIDYAFTRQRHPRFTWTDFVDKWIDRPVTHVRYEDARAHTSDELIRIARELTGLVVSQEAANRVTDRYSFARQAGRSPGAENRSSFMRKGVVGDWRNQFTHESREVFSHFAGKALIRAGYETDDSWVR